MGSTGMLTFTARLARGAAAAAGRERGLIHPPFRCNISYHMSRVKALRKGIVVGKLRGNQRGGKEPTALGETSVRRYKKDRRVSDTDVTDRPNNTCSHVKA